MSTTGQSARGAIGDSTAVLAAALGRLSALARQPVPDDLRAWADRCQAAAGFPLLGAGRCAEPYVALQWNGERAERAGLGVPDLIVLTGLLAAWQHRRTLGDLEVAVGRAFQVRADSVAGALELGAPVTTDVVTAAVCAGVLSGVPECELAALADVAGTLMQVQSSAATHTAAGHTAAAGWLAVQVHLSGLVAYPGAFADTVTTATFPASEHDPGTQVRALVDGLR